MTNPSPIRSFPVPLTCPIDGSWLNESGENALCCERGHSFPVERGVPILLRDDVEQTIGIASASLARGRGAPGSADERRPDLYLESLGISEREKAMALTLDDQGSKIDPAAAVLIGATNGIAYKHLIGSLKTYPIPDIRLPVAPSVTTLLDVGCSWGRWSIAAARKGYRVVSIDPSLGALMAARRITTAMGLNVSFVCADARYLPFPNGSFDNVFSYSVVQHFSKLDASQAVTEMSRVACRGGIVLVQMPNRNGLRSQMHLAKRRYAEGQGFEVRYWTLSELRQLFETVVGRTEISVHCYFGLGLEPTDFDLMTPPMKVVLRTSEWFRRASQKFPVLKKVADSVYVRARKTA